MKRLINETTTKGFKVLEKSFYLSDDYKEIINDNFSFDNEL